MSHGAAEHLSPDARRLSPELPDRTPPSLAIQSRTRVQQHCEVCGAPYLISPAGARAYHTCSAECSRTLRRRQRTGRTRAGAGRRASGVRGGTRQYQHTADCRLTSADSAERTDVRPHSRTLVHILCTWCGGLRGRWSTHALPPPGLCWRCLWRVNAGLEPGIPLG